MHWQVGRTLHYRALTGVAKILLTGGQAQQARGGGAKQPNVYRDGVYIGVGFGALMTDPLFILSDKGGALLIAPFSLRHHWSLRTYSAPPSYPLTQNRPHCTMAAFLQRQSILIAPSCSKP